MGEKMPSAPGKLTCGLCGVPLELIKAQFGYLGHKFHTEVPRCPKCGQVFISEELARGRMAEVETLLEDK
ncbi:MAG: Mut7-C RNAse domain-containing protein [Synergistaceae bacterium]|jgi:ribosomal protein S27AE|nr:Mut7-C RNAse domain-containing protein [Synergistaceae bacterium]